MSCSLPTNRTTEPVSLTEAKLHCKVDDDDENDLVRGIVSAARGRAERFTGRTFVTATYTEKGDAFPDGPIHIRPTWVPLASVTSVAYIDTDGVSQTLATSKYDTDFLTEPGRIALVPSESWPSTESGRIDVVTVVYTAGYGAATAVPPEIKQAIKLIVGHWYLNRESVADVRLLPVPFAAEVLLWNYRILDIGEHPGRLRSNDGQAT